MTRRSKLGKHKDFFGSSRHRVVTHRKQAGLFLSLGLADNVFDVAQVKLELLVGDRSLHGLDVCLVCGLHHVKVAPVSSVPCWVNLKLLLDPHAYGCN
jgi:hypothetical protein